MSNTHATIESFKDLVTLSKKEGSWYTTFRQFLGDWNAQDQVTKENIPVGWKNHLISEMEYRFYLNSNSHQQVRWFKEIVDTKLLILRAKKDLVTIDWDENTWGKLYALDSYTHIAHSNLIALNLEYLWDVRDATVLG